MTDMTLNIGPWQVRIRRRPPPPRALGGMEQFALQVQQFVSPLGLIVRPLTRNDRACMWVRVADVDGLEMLVTVEDYRDEGFLGVLQRQFELAREAATTRGKP